MKIKKITSVLFAILMVFSLAETARATTLFWDDVLAGGEYSFDLASNTMVIDVQTVYNPYDSDDPSITPGGTGTTIDWKFTATFDDAIDAIADGDWEEYWGSNFRVGLFDDGTATYVRTGTNDLGQNTGTFTAEWSTITSTNLSYTYLNPPGPWYAILDLTRITYGGTPYTSSGAVTGAIGNDPAPIPEPGTFILFGAGLLGFVGIGYRRKRK